MSMFRLVGLVSHWSRPVGGSDWSGLVKEPSTKQVGDATSCLTSFLFGYVHIHSNPNPKPNDTHTQWLGAFGRAWLSAVKSFLSIKARGQWLPAVKSTLSIKARGKSLREAFLGRESPWKPGSGAIERAKLRSREPRADSAWLCLLAACTACEMAGSSSTGALFRASSRQKNEKRPISFFINAHVGRLLRLKSADIAAAANREGGRRGVRAKLLAFFYIIFELF